MRPPSRVTPKALALLALVAVSASPDERAVAGPAETLAWERDGSLRAAVRRGAAENRLVLAKLGTSWCSACRRLERVLGEPSLRPRLDRFVRLAYDAEVGEGRDVARRYNVVTYPTLLVLGPDGRERDRATGFLAAEALLTRLAEIEDGSGTLAELEKRLAETPADLALRLRVGTSWALRGERRAALRHLELVVQSDPDNRRGLAAPALLAKGKILLLRSLGEHALAAATLAELRRRFPRAPEAEAAVFSLAQALEREGKPRAADAVLRGWARTAAQHATAAWFYVLERTRPTAGLDHARRAALLDAKDLDAIEAAARLHEHAGEVAEAERAWQRAVALAPTEAFFRRRVALCRELLGQRARSSWPGGTEPR
ncbi:MAG: tetratricopeptide repeat protein [Deltaproteobacteria bacterium]|nr:tetratricopeptide repeat protein [Deltaproteobacteria bacterium]